MSKSQTMAKDTIIYMLAKGIEGIVGVLTISAMSYIYLPEQIGKYSAINIAITTLAMVSTNWLTHSMLRYVNKYEVDNNLDKFYSTVFVSWFKVNFAIIFLSSLLILGISMSNLTSITDNYPISLLAVSIGMYCTYNTAQLTIALLAGVRKSKVNLFLSIINAVGKFFSIIVLNNLMGVKIEWIFLSYIIFDFITSFVGLSKLNIYKHISYKNYDKEVLNILKLYGLPLMGNMIATSVLNKSDIYIITSFLGEEKAGIYQTNYSIVASAFILLATAAMRGSYPTILKTWSEGNIEETQTLLKSATRTYLLIALPAVIGIFCLSDLVAYVLFDELYREGHEIMGFVAMGMMMLGTTEYAIKPWELNANTREIFKRSLISGILNILLNVLFIKKYGYEFAGFSTFVAFMTYFLLARIGTRKSNLRFSTSNKSIFKISISMGIMGLIISYFKNLMSYNIISLAILIFIGIIIYFISLYVLGEIKNEVDYIKTKLKK